MKRYIKSFNYEVNKDGYPTYEGMEFATDSDMYDYIEEDDPQISNISPNLIEYDVLYVDNATDRTSHYLVKAHSTNEARRIAKHQLGKDCYHIIDVLVN